jgi:hypothetical protein
MEQFTGFIGPMYPDRAPTMDAQDLINAYVEVNELGTGKNQELAKLVHTPGLKDFASVSETGNRGSWACGNGRCFKVFGAKLYEVLSDGTTTARGTLNTTTGSVMLADSEQELMLVDGLNGYLLDFATNVFSTITDADFPEGADVVVYVDGYFIVNAPEFPQRFYISSLLDGTQWDALEFASKEGAPDPLVTIAVLVRDLILVGSRSTEVWINTGALDFPFERREFLEYGTAAGRSLQKIGGSLVGIARDDKGQGIIGRLMFGASPQRVSTFPIEHAIKGITDLSGATAWSYQAGGHSFYCLNIPGLAYTLVLDLGMGFWHKRIFLKNGRQERHRAQCHAFAFGKHLVGDYQTGDIFALDDEHFLDGDQPRRIERVSPHLTAKGQEITLNALLLEMEMGVGPQPHLLDGKGNPRSPQVMLEVSRDSGRTWSKERVADLGKSGEYRKRIVFRRLGRARTWTFRVAVADPVKVVFQGAFLDMEAAR